MKVKTEDSKAWVVIQYGNELVGTQVAEKRNQSNGTK